MKRIERIWNIIKNVFKIGVHYNDEYYYNRAWWRENRAFESGDLAEFKRAISDYTKAIKLNPHRAEYFGRRGYIYNFLGKPDLAIEDIRRSMQPSYENEDMQNIVQLFFLEDESGILQFSKKLLLQGFLLEYLLWEGKKEVLVHPFDHSMVVLNLNNPHIGKTMRQHLKKNFGNTTRRHLNKISGRYELKINADFDSVFDNTDDSWGPTTAFRKYLRPLYDGEGAIQLMIWSLYKDDKLVAGDIGIQVGNVYASYSGFYTDSYAGTTQLVLMAQELEKRGFAFWDFGPPMEYKTRLGAVKITHAEYKKLFLQANKLLV